MTEKFPKATHKGKLRIGDMTIDCAVLEGGVRVLSEKAFSRELSLVRGGYQFHQRRNMEGGVLPIYLANERLIPFISSELMRVVKSPRMYQSLTGGSPARGVDAVFIPEVCNVWLRAREAGVLTPRQLVTAGKAELIVRGLAQVGIIAMVDEATGYQATRPRDALERFLEKFISKELVKWEKTFPDEFYEQLYKLKGWNYVEGSTARPGVVAHMTLDIVYRRLAPRVLEELQHITPRNEKGRLKHKLFQRLTEDIGHPKLEDHLKGVTAIMRALPPRAYSTFHVMLQRAYPAYMENVQMGDFLDPPLEDED